MGFIELVFIGFGLAMDAFVVALGKGMSAKRVAPRHVLVTGLWFGGFQALMPIIGYLVGQTFHDAVSDYDHWVAFGLLVLIGLNMIREAVWGDEEHANADFGVRNMLLMAIATSIDALAVGISIAFLDTNIWIAALVIGVVTFILSSAGVLLGRSVVARMGDKAAWAGGIILIAIGIKIIIEHTA